MRSIWTGAIGFGLVNIPVKLFSAVQESDLDLDMLDKSDLSHIKYMRVNESTGKEVSFSNIVKGYNYEGEYVIITDQDFEKAAPEKTKRIEISDFVQEDEINSLYYENPYYLEPEKSGTKSYGLLNEALRDTKKVAIGSFVLRNKESLVLLKPLENIIVLHKMRFGEEIRPVDELKIPTPSSKPAELKMAIALIEQLTGPFDITKYKDTYTEKLLEVIEDKAKGKKQDEPVMRITHSKASDLMKELKASLDLKKKRA